MRGTVVDAAAIIILDRPEYSLGNPLEIQATVRKLIFMTALAETGNKVKGLEAGAVDYITKPFQREELQARIAVHLHNRELTKRLQEAKELLKTRVEERTAELAWTIGALHDEIVERERGEKERVRLAAAQGTVKNHGGAISVYSKPGQGRASLQD